jgi:hypothetical protein
VYRRGVVLLTFTEVSYPLSIDRVAIFVYKRDEKVAEMSDDRPADTFCDDPLHDGFGFDISKLLHRQYLWSN